MERCERELATRDETFLANLMLSLVEVMRYRFLLVKEEINVIGVWKLG